MKTVAVNIRLGEYDEYCGRGSIFGNPYEIGVDGTREEVIERYKKKWFPMLLKDKRAVRILRSFKGKRLGCFCKDPNKEVPCHVDVIVDWVEKNVTEDEGDTEGVYV